MRRSIKIVFLTTILTILSLACKNKLPGHTSTNTIELSLHQQEYPVKLTREKDYLLETVTKEPPCILKIDDPAFLYIFYLRNINNNSEIIKMTRDFQVKNQYVLRYGQGPGEAINPRVYGGNENQLLVYDPPGYKYLLFDTSLKFQKDIHIPDLGIFLYQGGRFIPGHNLVVDGFLQYQNANKANIRIYTRKINDTHVTDHPLYETSQIERRKKDRVMILGKPIIFDCINDHIFILDKRNYYLTKMDLQGKITTQIKVDFTPVSFPAALRAKWLKEFDNLYQDGFDFPGQLWPANWFIHFNQGIAVARCENYDPRVVGPIPCDYFDLDLNYLGKIHLPYFYFWNHPGYGGNMADILYYSQDWVLFFIETKLLENGDELYRIVKYRITNEKDQTKTLRP